MSVCPSGSHPVHLRAKADAFAFIDHERHRFGVTRLCRLFTVTRAGFCGWRRRPVRARTRRDRIILNESGVLQSMTRGGAPDENAHMESFFHSLTSEATHGRLFASGAALRQALRRCMRYYNDARLHSPLEYRPPVDDERTAA